MNNSRIKNSMKNSIVALLGQLITIIMQFILRSLFIKILGIEYLGINGLFLNILNVLSLTELGIGATIIYSMYKPISEGDKSKINQYVCLYKKIYFYIGSIIFIVGLFFIPFLKYLITEVNIPESIYIIYLLFLINSVTTYFFAHYRSFLTAYQKDYINNFNKLIFLFIQSILQMFILLYYKSYILYLIIQIITNICSSFYLATIVKRDYKDVFSAKYEKMNKIEMKNIFKNSLAMFSQKLGYVILNSTDNIVISVFISTTLVGVYSNYGLIIGTVSTILSLIVGAIGASIGNLIAENDKNKCKNIFNKINFIYFILYGFVTLGLYNLMPDFISIWIGKEFILNEKVILILVINFYISGMRQGVLSFTNGSGLFWKMRFKPIYEVIINLVVSIVLANSIGLIGVFIGTFSSLVLTSFWYEPVILYKYLFEESVYSYFKTYAKYTMLLIITNLIIKISLRSIIKVSIGTLVIKILIFSSVFSIIFLLVFYKTAEFQYFKNIAIKMLGALKKKVKLN